MATWTRFLLILCLIFSPLVLAQSSELSPIGFWQSIDDVTNKPKSIIHITQKGDILSGKVVKIFPKEGSDQNKLCTACQGPLKNQKVVGLTILTNLKKDGDQWSGKILDPENGKVYNCNVSMQKNNELLVRGYIGISLFGRSQTWLRTGKSK